MEEVDPLEDYFSDSDFSVYESNRGGDSPMEIKSIYNSPFVRHGFGRVSTTSSSYMSSENPNCVEEMSSEGDSKTTTVQHCISKYNSKAKEENRMQSKFLNLILKLVLKVGL